VGAFQTMHCAKLSIVYVNNHLLHALYPIVYNYLHDITNFVGQDVKSNCAYCANGYKCNKNKTCSQSSAYKCPAAAGPNCLSCSPTCSGVGSMVASCMTSWQAQWGCSLCAKNYVNVASTTPIPPGSNSYNINKGNVCGVTNVMTCQLMTSGWNIGDSIGPA
jgi:hypothetical protein